MFPATAWVALISLFCYYTIYPIGIVMIKCQRVSLIVETHRQMDRRTDTNVLTLDDEGQFLY